MERPALMIAVALLTLVMVGAVFSVAWFSFKEEVIDKKAWDKLIGPGVALALLVVWYFEM